MAIARLTKQLIDAGFGVEGLRMLKDLSERDIRRAAESGDETMLIELALRVLYQRKAFREETGMDEEHYPGGPPPLRCAVLAPSGMGPAARLTGRGNPDCPCSTRSLLAGNAISRNHISEEIRLSASGAASAALEAAELCGGLVRLPPGHGPRPEVW